MDYQSTPIPVGAGLTDDWQSVPIEESNEPLVALGSADSYPNIFAYSVYKNGYLSQIDEDQTSGAVLVRQDVANKLLRAQELLPSDIRLLVLDGLRTLETQELLYRHFLQELVRYQPHAEHDQLHSHTQKFVSKASVDPDCPAPHTTGGAIDVILLQNDEMLDFGTAFDHGSPKARLRYYENPTLRLSTSDIVARNNRRLLYWVLFEVGFEGYEHEWWHFNSPKSQMGAVSAGADSASYGYIEPHEQSSQPLPLPFAPDRLHIERIAPSSNDVIK